MFFGFATEIMEKQIFLEILEAMKQWNVNYGKKLKQWSDEAFNAGKELKRWSG